MKVFGNPWVFLDLEIDDTPVGRIIFELFFDKCQKTCENFRCLCTGEKGKGKITGKPLHYKGVYFHKVIPGSIVQSGDFSQGNGHGGESIYGDYFDDESFDLKHNEPFLLSMASKGKDKNGSLFSITTQPAPHLDGVQVVFGRVVSGSAVVKQIESQKTDLNNRPLKKCQIVNCGELPQVKKAKKRHKKRSVSVDSYDLSSASVSGDHKSKKKKKKRKKEKRKKQKKRKRYSLSEFPSKEENSSKRAVAADEVPDVPSNKFLHRTDSKENDGIDDTTPPSQRSQSKRWRSKSGRKIKGRGSLRYRTPSRSRSRSSLERPYSVTPGRTGSDTPPHWRQAQKGQRSLKNLKTSPFREDKWRKDSSSPFDKTRNDGWDSDVDNKRKSSTGRWSGEESDEREVVAAMVRRHLEKKLSNTFDDGLFGPVAKPNVKKNSRATLPKKSRMKQESLGTKDVTRSKWDTPERQSMSPSIDNDVSDMDERLKDSGDGRVVSGVVGYEKLLEPQKLRHKHKKKKKIQENHKKGSSSAPNQQTVGKQSKNGSSVSSKHRSITKTKPLTPTSGKVMLREGSLDSSRDRERHHYQRTRSPKNRKRSKQRRSSTSSYSSRTSSNEYRRRKRQRRYSVSDNSVSGHRSSASFSERYSSGSMRRLSSRSDDSRGHPSMVSSRSASSPDFSGENSSVSTPVPGKNKVDVAESPASHDKSLLGRTKKKLHKKAKASSKSLQPVPASRERKKKPRKEPQLPWQPPLEFGEEIEEEIVEVKVESKNQKQDVSQIKEEQVTLKDEEPVEKTETMLKNGKTDMADDFDDIDALLSSALDVQKNPNKRTKQKIDVKQKLLLLQQATAKETTKPGETSDHVTELCHENKEIPSSSNSQPFNVATSPTDTVPGGFGFIPKYEPPLPITPPKVIIKTIKSPSPEQQVQDVGIWSDEESDKNKIETCKLSKPSPSAENKVLPSPKIEKAISKKVAVVKQEIFQVSTASPVLPSTSVQESKASKVSEKVQNKSVDVKDENEDDDDDTEENDLLVHEPVATSKKPFVFNIKLPKPESEPSKPKKKRKKQKKLNKKRKEKQKTPSTISTAIETSANATATVTTAAISTPSTTSPATSAAMTPVTSDVITNTAQSQYPPPNMLSHPSRAMGLYNPYYPTPHPYMGPRGIVPPGHMYPHHFHSQFMGFHQGHPPLPVEMSFQPALPDDNAPPPLPSENEPEKPPEPVFDSQRLSDQKVAAMFASHDITKEKVEKFFDDDKNLSDIPSPASSRSSSLFRKRRRRKRHHQSRRHRRYSSSSRGSSSRSRRSYSSDSSSRSPSGRRGRGRSLSSSDSSYRSRSYSSDRSFRGRSSRRNRHSRSRSYFSSSSSRDRRRSTSSYSSSGSDMDRPCRHYRPGRRRSRRPRYSSYDQSSDRSDISRLSSRTRCSSRSWSRDRSPSRSSFSSRDTYSD